MMETILPTEWRWTTLDEVALKCRGSIVSGPFGSNISSKFFVPVGVPVIRGNNLTRDMQRFVDEGFVFLTEEKAAEFSNCEAVAEDLVFTAAGTIGQVGIIPIGARYPRYIISNKQLRARLDTTKIHPLFAFYWLSSPTMVCYIEQRNTGSSVPLINLSVLRSLPIPVPPLPEQRSIADVLGSMDDKIESNRRTSRAFERVARAIFRAWFVDFDPVKAKVAGADFFPGMPQEAFKSLPTRLVESELGLVPEGWEVGRLDDVVEMRMERIDPSEETARLPYVPIECISPKSLSLQDWKQGSEAQTSLQHFYRGDILFGAMRPYFHKVCLAPFDGTTRTTAFVLVPRKATHYSYVALLVHDPSTVDYATQHSVGSTIPYAKWERSLANMPVAIPPRSHLEAFEEIVRPMLEPFMQNTFENARLRAMHDYLLPKLLSGEVRVADMGDISVEGPTR